MSDRLTQARTFTLKARVSMELPVGGGALATFVNDATASVQRPDKLAAIRAATCRRCASPTTGSP